MNKLFDNIEIAFAHKDTNDLKKSKIIFKYLFNNKVIAISKIFLNSALKINFPIKWFVKPTIYRFFCAGETLSEAIQTAQKLYSYKVTTVLDYAAEEVKNQIEAEKTFQQIQEIIDKASEIPFISFAVFKPTALCRTSILEKKSKGIELTEEEKQEYNKFLFFVDKLCEKANQSQIPILIDAEYISIQDIIDKVALEMMIKYNKNKAIVFNTLQMYRKDRLQYLKNLYKISEREQISLGVKLVRGAYLEQERALAKQQKLASPVFELKEETDKSYNDALRFCLERINKISVFSGTHNEESNYLMIDLMKEYNIEKNDKRVFSSQLYGMSDNITFNLANAGYNVSKYMPFGDVKTTIPYLLRRADENKSIGNQISRELSLINQAIKIRLNEIRQ